MQIKNILLIITLLIGYLHSIDYSEKSLIELNNKHIIKMNISDIINFKGAIQENPTINLLDKEDIRLILNTLSKLPKFPKNIFNGCHARAHYTYLELSKVVPKKVYKV